MDRPQVVIRKYSDRRLYDAGASRYVKLEDIARMVRDGMEVRVVDDRTGKDITQVIYTQIIVENAREKEHALPLQLLTQLVRTSDKATHEFLTWYLDNTLDLYKKAQETVHGGIADAKRAVSSPLEFVRNILSQHPGAVPHAPASEAGNPGPADRYGPPKKGRKKSRRAAKHKPRAKKHRPGRK
jgi:polyhydroxyalkanoate synthesis repressor PhaR